MSLVRDLLSKVDINEKVIIDPFCGTGTTILASLEKNPKLLIGTDIQPDFIDVIRYELKGIIKTKQFSSDPLIIEYGIDAKASIRKYDFDIMITDPPNPFMIVGFTNARMPRDLHMSGNEIKNHWKPKLVKGNLINKREETIQYVKELFNEVLDKNKRIIGNMFSTKNGTWSYLKEFENDFSMDPISGQWCEINHAAPSVGRGSRISGGVGSESSERDH
jgi:DNA modification methylase